MDQHVISRTRFWTFEDKAFCAEKKSTCKHIYALRPLAPNPPFCKVKMGIDINQSYFFIIITTTCCTIYYMIYICVCVIFMSYIIWYTIYFAILLHVPLEQPPLSCMLLQHNNCCVIWHILFSTLWSCFTLVALPFHALYILNKVISVTASCGVSINECNNEGVHLPEIGD